MAIGDTDVELQFTNVVANVPVVVGIQNTGVQTEILVRYGIQRYTATLGVDYSLVFPVDLLTFQLTPTQSLINKIIAAGGTNVIFVQRVLPLTSDFDYDNAFVRQKLVDEFNRVWMVLQQEDFRLGLASPVTSWNGRVGDVHLFTADVSAVGGALIDSPHFTGIPTAITGPPGDATTRLATDAFVNAAVNVAITSNAVTTWNTRQGNVTLTWADVSAVGAAPLANPIFTGNPQAPTAAVGDRDTTIATTAFVQAAIGAISSGVVSWNARVGVVTMTSADITAAGGALASQLPVASTAVPLMNGVAVAGAATTWSRADHVHPTDTSLRFPTGTTMLFQQTAAPTGWVKQTTHNDKALRVVSGTAASGGVVSFSSVFGKTGTDPFTLSINEMPNHQHGTVSSVGSGSGAVSGTSAHHYLTQSNTTATGAGGRILQVGDGNPSLYSQAVTGSAGISSVTVSGAVPAQGGNLPHSHTMNIQVQYVDVIICSKS